MAETRLEPPTSQSEVQRAKPLDHRASMYTWSLQKIMGKTGEVDNYIQLH